MLHFLRLHCQAKDLRGLGANENKRKKLQRSGLTLTGKKVNFFHNTKYGAMDWIGFVFVLEKSWWFRDVLVIVGQCLESHSLFCFSYYPTRLEVRKELGGNTTSWHFAVWNLIQLPWAIIPACTGPSTEPSYPPADQRSCPPWCLLKTDWGWDHSFL